MAPPADAFASFAEKWLAVDPAQRIVAAFRAPERRRIALAFGVLVHEIANAAFELREPQVAAAKLAWWRRELAQTAGGAAQHPITREIAAAAAADAVAGADWNALVDGAAALVDAAAPASFASQRAALAAFFRPVAAAEALLLGATPAAENVDLWTACRLVRWLRGPALHDHALALPLDLLARQGVTRAGLDVDAPARRALFVDLLASIERLLRDALAAGARADLGRRVRGRLDLYLATRAAARSDPARWLASAQPGRWRILWSTWREARRGA